jgi:hypothetical protein
MPITVEELKRVIDADNYSTTLDWIRKEVSQIDKVRAACLSAANDYSKLITQSIGVGTDWRKAYDQALKAMSESTSGLGAFSIVQGNMDYFMSGSAQKAMQMAFDSLSKNIFANTNWIAGSLSDYFEAQSRSIKEMFAPFLREWAPLLCDVDPVCIDIDDGANHILHAEYKRAAVIDLIMAMLAFNELQPGLSISPSGKLSTSESLFECSEEHTTHQAHYFGETKITSEEETDSEEKSLSQWFVELRQKKEITKDDLD